MAWCPKGHLAEDGIIENSYKLSETPSADRFSALSGTCAIRMER